jgi:pantothenate synthetase
MSSRNRYLSAEERGQALVLGRALRRIEARTAAGMVDAAALIDAGFAVLAEEPEIRVDYLRIVDPETLEDVADVSAGALVAVAAVVGPARLIDNVVIAAR